nr:hypothetical protein [Tanacetum cinerariifolium]
MPFFLFRHHTRRNKHIVIDLGTSNNKKIDWPIKEKQGIIMYHLKITEPTEPIMIRRIKTLNRIPVSLLGSLRDVSFVKQCELPANAQRPEQLYMTGEFSDVDISVEGHGFFARSHKVILSLCSLPL